MQLNWWNTHLETNKQTNKQLGAGEMVQQMKASAAKLDDLSSVSSHKHEGENQLMQVVLLQPHTMNIGICKHTHTLSQCKKGNQFRCFCIGVLTKMVM